MGNCPVHEALEQAIARFRVISLDKVSRQDLSPLANRRAVGCDQVAISHRQGSTTDLCLRASGRSVSH